MDPMKSFEEFKLRLEQTLKEAKNESSFSSTYIQTENSIEDKFHKFPLTKKKPNRFMNGLKTIQKPKISSQMRVYTEQHDYQSCGERTPKSITFIDEGPLNMSNEHERIANNFNLSTTMKKPRQNHQKCARQIEGLKKSLQEQKIRVEEYEMEINKHKCEKVEYEEMVFQLKTSKQMLINEIQCLNDQMRSLEPKKFQNIKDFQASHYAICQRIDNFNPPLVQKDQSKPQNTLNRLQNSNRTNIVDLQGILCQMKEKVFKYEKQLQQKQTLYNHQQYLLEKLKNQRNQLHQSQASLLEELDYMLKQLKDLKNDNQAIKTQNQSIKIKNNELKREKEGLKAQNKDSLRQISLLQDINSKLQQDLSQLFMHIDQIEKQKIDLQNKLHDITSVTKQPLSDMRIDINRKHQILSPLNLEEKLRKQEGQTHGRCFTIEKNNKKHKFVIDNCIELSVEGEIMRKNDSYQFFKKDQISLFFRKDQVSLQNNIFSRSIELDDTFFLNELDISRQKNCQLDKQVHQSRKAQRQALEQLQKVQMKLKSLLKDLKILENEHRSMKKQHEQEKMKLEIKLKEKQTLSLSLSV